MSDPTAIRIHSASSAEEVAMVVDLFKAYADSLGIDLGYQNFSAELAAMPGKYAPPGGALLLARDRGDRPIGCVGIRPWSAEEPSPETGGCCEMKRLYVAPEGRGLGIGRALVNAAINEGRRLGHREMRLDTLPSMTDAQRLYRGLGFMPIAAYYHTPVAGTIFLARSLMA